MTKTDIRNDILGLESNCILAELPTGSGKSKIALDYMNEKQVKGDILIVIPRLVLIDNWKQEFIKWGYEPYLSQVTFTTYVSLPKHAGKTYELIIFDECHHLSERARLAVENIKSDYYILLSATVKKQLKQEIKMLFPQLECYTISMRKAIVENILPDPKVFLFELQLDKDTISETLTINPKANGEPVYINFPQRFAARKNKNTKFKCFCTQQQYYDDLSSTVEYYKKMYFRTNNKSFYFQWQQKAGERLKWLSNLKNDIVLELLDKLKDRRTLTFCNSILQTEVLGKYCINSQNINSIKYLNDFNDGKIDHITACGMLNEGANLKDCQVGIFVNISSSDIIIKQRNGRILRHKNPIIIIVYYKNTREEEIVKDMLQNYNPSLVQHYKLSSDYEIKY